VLFFFTAGLVLCFLLCFFTVEVAGAWVPLGAGWAGAGVWAANVMLAHARAIVIRVVFIFLFSLAGCFDVARSQSHDAARGLKTR